MPPSIPISSLLNLSTLNSSHEDASVNLQWQIVLLANCSNQCFPLNTPPHIVESLSHVLDYFGLWEQVPATPAKSAVPGPVDSALIQMAPTVHQNVYINLKTTLSVLYMYEDTNTWVEYPETKLDRPVGYLF